MKAKLFGLISLLLLGSVFSVWATDYPNLLFFPGIGSAIVTENGTAVSDADTVGMVRQVDLMKNHYIDNTQATAGKPTDPNYANSGQVTGPASPTPKVIVADSQGGVRALGFASKYPQYTAAVITLGSPVMGHPLCLNPATSKKNINDALHTILDGAAATVPVFGDVFCGLLLQGKDPIDFVVDTFGLTENSNPNVSSIAQMAKDASGTNAQELET